VLLSITLLIMFIMSLLVYQYPHFQWQDIYSLITISSMVVGSANIACVYKCSRLCTIFVNCSANSYTAAFFQSIMGLVGVYVVLSWRVGLGLWDSRLYIIICLLFLLCIYIVLVFVLSFLIELGWVVVTANCLSCVKFFFFVFPLCES
jgi:hypothetical protein